MRTRLTCNEPAWLDLGQHERDVLADWVARIVGPTWTIRHGGRRGLMVFAIDLIAEGAIRVEVYANEAGEPASQPSEIYFDRGIGDCKMTTLDVPAEEPPPECWPWFE